MVSRSACLLLECVNILLTWILRIRPPSAVSDLQVKTVTASELDWKSTWSDPHKAGGCILLSCTCAVSGSLPEVNFTGKNWALVVFLRLGIAFNFMLT